MRYIKIFTILLSIVFFQTILSTDSNADSCTKSSGVYTIGDITQSDGCEDKPSLYETVLYEGWLCTAAPTVPTTSSTADLSNCFKIFENISGATLSIVQLQEIEIDGIKFRPPPGSYTHAYLRLDNAFGITWAGQISGSMSGSQSGSGVFCGTTASSVTFSSLADHTNNSVCSSSEVTPGKLVETLASFSCCDIGGGSYESLSDTITVTGSSDTIRGIITDTNQHRSANDAEASRIEALLGFANPIKISEETRGMTVKFNLSNGIQLQQTASKLHLGGGPFMMLLNPQ